jgi:hypothetical protein
LGDFQTRGEVEMKKFSTGLKVFCYLGWDISSLLLAATWVINGMSIRKTLIMLIGNIAFMNLLFWRTFRMRDKRSESE